jgi:FkbM family methyltransferase
MDFAIFVNDNYAKIQLPVHPFSESFKTRVSSEKLFRRINTFLISNSYINGNMIDLGCWIGDNTVPWAKNIKGLVYGIDPSPNNCQFVKELSLLNGIDNIIILQDAISDCSRIISTNQHIDHAQFNIGDGGQVKLITTSLDTMYKNRLIHDIDYIHLDVEGMESDAIVGSNNLINHFQPIITFEQHIDTDNYQGLSLYLSNKNYDVFMINETLSGCLPDCSNFLALPSRIDINLLKLEIGQAFGENTLKKIYC